MDAWQKFLLHVAAQGAILAGGSRMNHRDNMRLLYWERSKELEQERQRMLMKVALFLAEEGELSQSKTEIIMMARRDKNV